MQKERYTLNSLQGLSSSFLEMSIPSSQVTLFALSHITIRYYPICILAWAFVQSNQTRITVTRVIICSSAGRYAERSTQVDLPVTAMY